MERNSEKSGKNAIRKTERSMNSNSSLRVSMIQAPIVWEDRTENVAYYGKLLHGLTGKTDLAVLPELFTTGLSMRVHDLSEPVDGKTIASVKQWVREYGFAVTGSFIA